MEEHRWRNKACLLSTASPQSFSNTFPSAREGGRDVFQWLMKYGYLIHIWEALCSWGVSYGAPSVMSDNIILKHRHAIWVQFDWSFSYTAEEGKITHKYASSPVSKLQGIITKMTARISINGRIKSGKCNSRKLYYGWWLQGIISCVQSHHLHYPATVLVSQHVCSVTTLLVRNSSAGTQEKLWTRPASRSQKAQKCKQNESLSNPVIFYREWTNDSWRDFLL